MKTSAYKSWTAEIEVEVPNGIDVFFRPAVSGFTNPILRIKASSTENMQEAERAVRDVVERLQKELA